ncbi:MAG: hypothetical protein RL391_881, partial [Actinomycetota bacterium]
MVDRNPFARRQIRTVLLLGAAAVIAVVGISISRISSEKSDDVETVVLDEPGEYQEPGIGTNRDLTGETLSAASLDTLDGDRIEASKWLDMGKPLLVNIWFSTCQPCKREMPALQDAFERYGDRIAFIGVNPHDSVRRLSDFTDEFGITYPQYRDTNSEFVVASGVATFPTTLVIGSDG